MASILIVDDEPDIVTIVGHYLRKRGFDFTSFNDPVKALAHFQENKTKYNFVVTDIRMPQMTGYALAQNIAIQEIFKVIFGNQSGVLAMIIYAVVVTIIAIIATLAIGRLQLKQV